MFRSVEDVKEWVKQIGFPNYAESFAESRVDGDLLLQVRLKLLSDVGFVYLFSILAEHISTSCERFFVPTLLI